MALPSGPRGAREGELRAEGTVVTARGEPVRLRHGFLISRSTRSGTGPAATDAFRAIENDTPILRPASFGISGAFDHFGRVLAETDHFSGAGTMVVEVPVGGVSSLYAKIDDVFA